MQSDDYSYFLKGGSISALYHHYMSWSGRLVADAISSTLLYFFSKPMRSFVNAFAFVSLMFMISIMPRAIRIEKKITSNDIITFFLVFLLYWVCNPNLGQTSFWIVGSANYLWTYLILVSYFLVLFKLQNMQKIRPYLVPFLFFLSVFAGWTNENTGVFAFVFTLFFVINKYRDKSGNGISNKILMLLCSGSLIGYIAMVLAPGNSIRASRYGVWYDKSILERVEFFMLERFPSYMESYWQILIFLLASVFILLMSEKQLNIKRNIAISFLFFVFSVFANIAFIGSPGGVAPRALNGSLVFLLISFSFVFESLLSSLNNKKLKFGIIFPALVFLLIYFLPSYFLFLNAVIATNRQENIRNEIIISNKRDGIYQFSIPDFYFSKLVKSSDAFDLFQNNAINRFWGVSKIEKYTINFDYSVIKENDKSILVNKEVADGLILERVYFKDEFVGLFRAPKHYVVYEFNKQHNKVIVGDDVVFFHVYNKKKDGFVNADIPNSKSFPILGKFYLSKNIPSKVHVSDIVKIQYGLYNKKEKYRRSNYEIYY